MALSSMGAETVAVSPATGAALAGAGVNVAAVSGAGLGAGVTAPCAVRRATFPGGLWPSGGAGLCPAGLSTTLRDRGAA